MAIDASGHKGICDLMCQVVSCPFMTSPLNTFFQYHLEYVIQMRE